VTGERDPDAIRISLHPSAHLGDPSGDAVVTLASGRRLVFADAPPGERRALSLLAAAGGTDTTLSDAVLPDGVAALARWHFDLDALAAAGALCYTVPLGRTPLARLSGVPFDVSAEPPSESGEPVVLSRFAYAHRDGQTLVLETPRSRGRIELLHPAAAAMVAALGRPTTMAALAAAAPQATAAAAGGLLALLDTAAMLAPADEPPHEALWEFGDLLFHGRSRWGLNARRAGAAPRLLGVLPPLPAVKPPLAGRHVPLHRPDIGALAAADPPFTRVLEARRSVRRQGARPVTVRELGEFLFRVARVRDVTEPDGGALPYAISSRPYPSAGACYPLELYPVVSRCDGLDRGIYHYDPARHRLEALEAREADVERLLDDASPGEAYGPPQVLLVITARFGRVSWKYESIAYALVLKDVGVLLQTMYLVATAMNLAPCALGTGDSARWARAAGLPIEDESSVGEFLLGSPADPT